MPEAVSTLVAEIKSEGGFDATDNQVLSWLNRRHKKMVARARSYRKTVTVTTTVAEQVEYTGLPADLVEAFEVTVGGVTYTRGRHSDISAGAQDSLTIGGRGGLFIETATSGAVTAISLRPPPSESGLDIDVYGAFMPPALLLNDSVTLKIDDDAVEGLLAGVFATALSRPGEARLDLVGGYEATFIAEADALGSRVRRRLRGSGPTQIRVSGVNA